MKVLFHWVIIAILMSCVGCVQKKDKNIHTELWMSLMKESYKKDSNIIITDLNKLLKAHEGFFSSKEYFDSTKILIDTILYSQDLKRLVVIIITENPTYRQLTPDNAPYYYNAGYFIFDKNDKLGPYFIGPTYTNSNDKSRLLQIVRNEYKTERKGYYKGKEYKYKIDDLGFWTCPIWYEPKLAYLRNIEFEKEKKEHPENIYIPTN